MTKNDFYFSSEAQPHQQRSTELLKKYPEISKLIGRNPNTFLIMLLLIGIQLTIAFYLGKLGWEYWWVAFLASWFIGAFTNHALYTVIHEATHHLIFKNKTLNKWCAIFADVVNVVPGGIGFSIYHLKHHAYMGDDSLDADLPSPLEARLVGNSTGRKFVWMFLFPVCQIYRTFTMHKVNTWTKWVFINIGVVFLADVLIVNFLGWTALFYLFFSMMFSLGLHPVGARWIQEHYTLDQSQETFSYYGPLNRLALNIGYHVEHHDFPSIPWNHLPRLQKIAPEYYVHLKNHPSWPRLLWNFLTNPDYSLYRRVKR
jgi:sphingolipid delta-4 desaturase